MTLCFVHKKTMRERPLWIQPTIIDMLDIIDK